MDVLEVAADAVATGPVCDACLGRLVADRSFGLTNAERGRALRTSLALASDEPFEPPEPADCWVCEGRCTEFDEWADRAAAAVEDVAFDTYNVGTRTPPLIEENGRFLREECGLDPDAGEAFNSEFNREVGKRVGRLTGAEVSFDRPNVQFTIDLDADRVDAKINSAFVYGRYRKLERDIPQTEWPCRECHGSGRDGREPCDHCDGTGYLYEHSVEQYVAPIAEDVMDGTDAVFHGAGREDVDARMLGTGRPFVIEVEEPRRRRIDVERLEADVNAFADGAVEVEGLRLATHEMVERVKGLDASKRYRAFVAFDEAVPLEDLRAAAAELDGATIEQYTPTRVDHRRANLTREREVYDVTVVESLAEIATDAGEDDAATGATADDAIPRFDPDDPSHSILEIHGEGGLYIKELVSSDEGRTEPSLAGLLGVDATVLHLDVLAVAGEDEPFADEAYFLDGDA
ncbi:tRNA pseudouridine(54/55) synthase Pus10 [Halopenitus persicus]|uniref:tRNA pseudouridine synthase Pus10 n=1 Tax=Halopenitus persicus TaxID=1048396 RepID=A0A1H3KZR3_9EURY|nr:tRNA pseudouridine(54/55) synthase Pus10 [Halopenitus persicus]SDY57653.1 tRNA pseudouridine synthase 10 [Halopenitus persicus]